MNFSHRSSSLSATTVAALTCLLTVSGCGSTSSPQDTEIKKLGVEIVNTYPFDPSSFTQGLEVDGDRLIVSTGWNGESRIYHRTLDGKQSDSQSIAGQYFGEGATRYGDTVWNLTWKAGIAFKRDANTLESQGFVTYHGQGWGLCSYPDEIVMSDGTDELRILDGDTFAEKSRVKVTKYVDKKAQEVKNLNELACTEENGTRYVYSNVFTTTDIYKINLESGNIEAIVDASSVPNRAEKDPNNVLNGIANIPGTDRFYITGKRWPDLYEVRFVPKD